VLYCLQCGAVLTLFSKLLAVERFARCNDVGSVLQSAESINCF
jgi:hypothetical protein